MSSSRLVRWMTRECDHRTIIRRSQTSPFSRLNLRDPGYGLAALKLSNTTVPGLLASFRQVPPFNSKFTEVSGTADVFHEVAASCTHAPGALPFAGAASNTT